VRGIAAIRNHPAWDSGHKGEEIEALWRLASLPGRERKAQRATPRIGNGMGLGAEAALAAAERFVVRARWLGCVVPLFAAPAALWCARRMVPSMKTMPSAGQPATLAASKRRSQTPSLDQRMKVWAAIQQGPNSAGMARHLAPFCMRQTIASTVRRRFVSSRPVWGRTASIKGSIALHWTSVRIGMASLRRWFDTAMTPCARARKSAQNPPFRKL
jgi:hypothetical protein